MSALVDGSATCAMEEGRDNLAEGRERRECVRVSEREIERRGRAPGVDWWKKERVGWWWWW